MVAQVLRYSPIVIKAAKVLHTAARHYMECTPQERETIRHHLRAIYEALKKVYERIKDVSDLPPLLMLPPPDILDPAVEPHNRNRKRTRESLRQFHKSMRQFARVIRLCGPSFTFEEAEEITAHLNEVRKILSQINRRTRT